MGDEVLIDHAEAALVALSEAYRQAVGNRDDLQAQAKELRRRIGVLEARAAEWEAEIEETAEETTP